MHPIRDRFRRSALRAGLALLAIAGLAPAADAAPPALAWPLDCRLGEDCWIVHHPDTDPGPGAQDFRCGSLTYDGHKGTDIALRDRAAMFQPVPVRAAAAGIVLGTRDTAADHLGDATSIQAAIDKGEECGNGLRAAPSAMSARAAPRNSRTCTSACEKTASRLTPSPHCRSVAAAIPLRRARSGPRRCSRRCRTTAFRC